MIQIKRILAPTDFSISSEQSLRYAAEMAELMKSKIYVLHVAEHANVGGDPDAGKLLIPEYLAEVEQKLRERLNLATDEIRTRGIEVYPIFVVGRAYAEIVQQAKDLAVDLIVLSTHGRTGFTHLVFGSTAERVVRLAACPVLTIRSQPKPNAA
jgi:nucleotide-binding universal stress UspA family protein